MPSVPPDAPKPLTRFERLLAAGSFTLIACSALLIWTAYKDREAGITLGNIARFLGAGVLLAFAVRGTQIRHRPNG